MDKKTSPFLEVLTVFTRLGFTAFGGPAAHIALFRQEVVQRRQWVTDAEFLDLLAATNLIPGPNSTEMAIHLGYRRAGWAGMLVGGLGFTVPATLIVFIFAWLYTTYGSTPQAAWLLYGIKPVMIAVILQALWVFGKKTFQSIPIFFIGAGALVLYFLEVNELFLLFLGGLACMLWKNRSRLKTLRPTKTFMLAPLAVGAASAAVPFDPALLFFTFLKIGSILYGSGYVLVAFLRTDFVSSLGWLTEQQLLDAIAVGQVTPGPLFTSATFIGYLLDGIPGGLLATAGIFLPSYVFVALSSPLIPRLRGSAFASSFLDGVIAASLGLMAAVSIQLGIAALVDPLAVAVGVVSLIVLFRFSPNATWLIAAGALVGLIRSLLGF
jgi:chromate transporter